MSRFVLQETLSQFRCRKCALSLQRFIVLTFEHNCFQRHFFFRLNFATDRAHQDLYIKVNWAIFTVLIIFIFQSSYSTFMYAIDASQEVHSRGVCTLQTLHWPRYIKKDFLSLWLTRLSFSVMLASESCFLSPAYATISGNVCIFCSQSTLKHLYLHMYKCTCDDAVKSQHCL